MKIRFVLSFALAASFFLVCIPSSAHHGNSAYDEKNPVTLKGIVTEFAWADPHCQIYFDVKDDKGKSVRWSVETLSPGRLLRAVWTKEAVKVGDQITITLDAAKNGAPVGFLRKLAFADGRALGIRERPNYQSEPRS